MIDLHCHYLPGVDDGARTLDDALALIRASSETGVVHSVLTPHVYPGVWDNTGESLMTVFERLQAAVVEAGIPMTLSLGAEVRLHPESLEAMLADRLPLIGELDGDRIMLLEFPDGNIPPGALQACQMMIRKGIRPMIAHPERNKDVMRDPDRIRAFLDAGCLTQVTAASVIGQFGEPALKAAHQLLAMGLISIVATDAHNLMHRPPLLHFARDAIRRSYGPGLAYRLTEELPGLIVSSDREAVPTARAA